MWSMLIPAAMSLIGAMGSRGGSGGTGGTTGDQIDPMLAALLPQYRDMFQMEAAKQKASLPLYNAVLNQAFGGLPSWARSGVPGVDLLGITPEMLVPPAPGTGLGRSNPNDRATTGPAQPRPPGTLPPGVA